MAYSSFLWKSPSVVLCLLNLPERREVVEEFKEVSKLPPVPLLMVLGQNKVISYLFSLRQLCGVVSEDYCIDDFKFACSCFDKMRTVGWCLAGWLGTEL